MKLAQFAVDDSPHNSDGLVLRGWDGDQQVMGFISRRVMDDWADPRQPYQGRRSLYREQPGVADARFIDRELDFRWFDDLLAFVANLLGGLIAFRNGFAGAIIAAILFAIGFVAWNYYPHSFGLPIIKTIGMDGAAD
jgi:hypothetical protein